MFDSTPLLIETAALVLAAYLAGCIVGFGLRRVLMAARPQPSAATLSPQPQPAPLPAPPVPRPTPAEEFASIAGLRTTPAQQLAAALEAERKTKFEAALMKAEEEARARKAAAAMAATAQAAAPPDAPVAAESEAASAPSRHHATFGKPAALEAPREGHKDNLKLIKGIGPRIEKGLNDLGVFHFDQIAAWDKKTVVWVETHFAFRGRIGRERWVQQAQDLSRAHSHPLKSVKA